MILDRTPFYAEAGGQVGDSGELTAAGVRFAVRDTQKRGAAHAHIGTLAEGSIRVGDTLDAQVDGAAAPGHPCSITRATHLLHAALRQVLGTHVQQKGSLVAPDRLRFDFSHFQAITTAELHRDRAARQRADPRQRAGRDARDGLRGRGRRRRHGAVRREVRQATCACCRLGDFSIELCGGTHVRRAGDIGLFKIISESGVAAGVRRIEALTGEAALDCVEQSEALLKELAGLVRGSREELADKVREQLERNRQMERELRSVKDRLASGQGVDLAAGAVDIQGVKVVATRVQGADASVLRTAVDQLKDRLKSAVVVLASVENASKVVLVVGVTADQTGRIKAGELAGAVAAQVGGRGGGRADFAQAGGSKPEALDAALSSVQEFVRTRLSA